MSSIEIEDNYQQLLLDLALLAIRYGLAHGKVIEVDEGDYPEPLREHRATFVTLKHQGQLRGCIGTLEAYRPLVKDVAANAYAAAFSDPRFRPVTDAQLPDLKISISILMPSEELSFENEVELIGQLRPGVDGLILQEGSYRGTFLPSVWESLPDKHQFLEHLKRKAGLATDYWSDKIRVYRYTTQSFGQS